MNKKILSLLLIFMMVLSPIVSLADSNIDINISVIDDRDNVRILISGEKNRQASISIKSGDKYFLIDQKELDDKGRLEYNIYLPRGSKYSLLINIDGQVESRTINRIESIDPGIPTPVVDRAGLNITGYKGSILAGQYEIKKDDTVLSFTKRILDSKNISYEDRGGYIASIDGQSELDKGKNSGWTYTVNGKMPNQGAGNIYIKQNDNVVWKYVYDFINEENRPVDKDEKLLNNDLEKLEKELAKENIKDIDKLSKEIKENLGYSLNKDRKTMEKAIELSMRVNKLLSVDDIKSYNNKISLSKVGDIVLRKEFISILQEKSVKLIDVESNNIKLSMNVSDIDLGNDIVLKLKNSNGISIFAMNGDKKLERLGGLIRIELPVENYSDASKLRVKSKSGKLLGGLYNRDKKVIVFETREFGEFIVDEGDISFTDIENHWSRVEIISLANKGIVKGVTDRLFEPNRDISRAEFVSLVNRLMKYEDDNKDMMFSDVAKDSWYSDDVRIISNLGIIKGIGEKNFNPNGKITREEMATIVARVLDREDYKGADSSQLDKYIDKEEISSWAESGLASLSKYEILKGDNQNRLNPSSNASRAEASVILLRLYSLILFN